MAYVHHRHDKGRTIIKLTKDAFTRARDFIDRHARPLDIARFQFHFDNGSRDAVWRRVAQFQNPDGGFGRAIEPDIRAPESSALGTSIALRIVREIGGTGQGGGDSDLGSREPSGSGAFTFESDALETMVRSSIGYLLATFDEQIGGWRIVPPSIERSPHAPWWRQTGREDAFNRFSLNPNAELLGYLLDYREFVPAELLQTLTDKVIQTVAATTATNEAPEMHELLCCKRLAESDSVDAQQRDEIVAALSRQLDTVVGGPDEWDGYSLRPLQVAESPHSPFYGSLEKIIPDNLDYEISNQQPDGSWAPTWSWGDDHQYPRVWEAAKFEWAGVLTVDTLIVLKRFGRAPGLD